jgi:hypothetical protein
MSTLRRVLKGVIMKDKIQNQNVIIDEEIFFRAFGRIEEEERPCRCYLARRQGTVLWVYGSNEDVLVDGMGDMIDNELDRASVAAHPDDYVELPGFDLSDHMAIVETFLSAEILDEEDLRKFGGRMRKCAKPSMMGEFGVPLTISGEYEHYLRETHLRPRGEGLLSYHGLTAVWK